MRRLVAIRHIQLVLVLAFFFHVTAVRLLAEDCALAAPSSADVLQNLMQLPQPPFILKSGDSFQVSVYGVTEYNVSGRVATDGTAVLPLIGSVTLRGLTIEQAQGKIAAMLDKTQMIDSPQVIFVVLDSPTNMVSVIGEVNKPGAFPDVGKHTLYEFIANSGGLTHTACHVITLRRPGMDAPLHIPLGPDPATSQYASMPIFPGDSIQVPVSGVIYVVGAVKLQGAYALKPDSVTTVLQAVALAGGEGYEAEYGSTVIVRDSPNGPKVMYAFDLKKVFAGKEADLVLQPNDILFVPTSKMKAAIKGGAASMATALAGAFIYASRP